MRSQIANRLRSNSIPLNSVPPPVASKEYSIPLSNLAARILYRSPLPSQNDLPVFILNAAAFPDIRTTDYDTLLPYVLARLPDNEELIGGHGYEVVFFAGGDGEKEAMHKKKGRPGWAWFMQAYHVLTRATRKRLHMLYIVHEKKWIRVLVEMFATVVSPKFRKKIVHVSTLSGLALHIPIEDLLIPPSAYLTDRRKSPDIHAPYVSGRRAFAIKQPLHTAADGSLRLPRVLREATSFVLMDDNLKVAGIFRVSARSQSVEVLKEAYDRGQKFIVWKEPNAVLASTHRREGMGDIWVEELDQTEGFDIHTAAALIKLWYKELKEPIFPTGSYQMLERYYGHPEAVLETAQLFAMLSMDDEWTPIHNRASRHILIMHLLPLLHRVAEFHDWNYMTPENLAVCFAPSLLRGPDPIEDLKLSTIIRRILAAMIIHWKDLEPLLDTTFEDFADSLRMPEAVEDREDPLEEAQGNHSAEIETQISGIVLQDNEDSEEDEEESPPPLPPRPRAATVDREVIAWNNSFDVALADRADASELRLNPRTGSVDAILPNSPHEVSNQGPDTGFIDISMANGVSPVRRKPAPALLPLPRYSTIVNDRPAALRDIQYYNTVPPDDDGLEEEQHASDLPVYQEGTYTYEEPTHSPASPSGVNDASIQRKPLPKTGPRA